MSIMSDLNIEKNELEFLRSEVVALLHAGLVDLDFEKADGSLRQMTATLKQSELPMIEDDEFKVRSEYKPNPNVVTCFDVQIKEWRSFRIDRLRKFSVVDEGM